MTPHWTVDGVGARRVSQKNRNSKSIVNKDLTLSEKKLNVLVCPPSCSCNCLPPSFQVLATSCIAMSPSTRAKNANQHPGHILLADTKKRRTKEEIAADNKKKHLEKKTTEAALHRLYEYIAGEEDHLAEDEVNAHKKKFPPSLFPQPLDHQNAPIRWDSDNECEVDANTKQGKRTGAIPLSLTLKEPQIRTPLTWAMTRPLKHSKLVTAITKQREGGGR